MQNMFKNNVIDVVLIILLLTLNIFHTFSSVSIVNFEQVNVNWIITIGFLKTCKSIRYFLFILPEILETFLELCLWYFYIVQVQEFHIDVYPTKQRVK